MTTTVTGRLGGQYALEITEDQRYRVRGTTPQTSGVHTLFSGDYETATRILDYCQQHDGLAQEAIRQLFYNGDPTAMLGLVEAAKVDPATRGRKRVALYINIETDILESEDAIANITQQASAALKMCAVTVRSIEANYIGQVEPPRGIGIDFCINAIEQALMMKAPKGTKSLVEVDRLRELLLEPRVGETFDLEQGTGDGHQ